jgi:hypothetical protein
MQGMPILRIVVPANLFLHGASHALLSLEFGGRYLSLQFAVLEIKRDMPRKPAVSDLLFRKTLALLVVLTSLHLPSGASQDTTGSWPGVNLDPGAMRYSPLAQITAANVNHLKVAWIYHMKPAPAAGSAPDALLRPSEDQPLVVGNTMFVVTPYSRVVALDSATGREKGPSSFPGLIRHRCAEPHIGPETIPPALLSSSEPLRASFIRSVRQPARRTQPSATTEP